MNLKSVLTIENYYSDVKMQLVLTYLLNDIERAIYTKTYIDIQTAYKLSH